MFFAPLHLRVRNFDKRRHRIPVIENLQRRNRSLLPPFPKSDIINSVCYMSRGGVNGYRPVKRVFRYFAFSVSHQVEKVGDFE